MKRFTLERRTTPDDDQFDRQRRITWWQQERLRDARVMVVGAGAIGNETLKNLALLGIGYFFIVDFDTIAPSNLSRTLLFRPEDVGKRKAEVAAERLRELCLEPTAAIDWFHGDLVSELGTGVFAQMDLVLGCVDNLEARLAINRQCWRVGVPWIDAGISELAGHVTFYQPTDSACYRCGTSAEKIDTERRQRYSCDHFKRSLVAEGRAATVQISSAVVAALQVQEAVKYLCGKPVSPGQMIFFQGANNDFDTLSTRRQSHCIDHGTYPGNRPSLELSVDSSLGNVLTTVSAPALGGEGATLDLSQDVSLVLAVKCHGCSTWIELNRPQHQLYDRDAFCGKCQRVSGAEPTVAAECQAISRFSLAGTPAHLLVRTLAEIGVPPLAILPVISLDGSYRYINLVGDLPRLLPNLSRRASAAPGRSRPQPALEETHA